MKIKYLLFSLVIGIVLLGACSAPAPKTPIPTPTSTYTPALTPTPTSTPTPTLTSTPNLSLTYENSNYGISIKYPQDWIKQEGDKEAIVAFLAPKESASATLAITVQDLPAKSPSLSAYTQNIISKLGQTATDFNLIESSETTLAGSPAYKVVFTGKQGHQNLEFLRVWTIVNNKGYIITYAADSSKYSDVLGIIQQMIDSFSIPKATPTLTSTLSPTPTSTLTQIPTPTPTTLVAGQPFADPIKIDSGIIYGTSGGNGAVHVYKGIPFAAPPVGDLRWKPPQPVTPWTGVRYCTEFGPVCTQLPAVSGMSEDCLYLNVYTPAKMTSDRLPVIVFYHGGTFVIGGGSQYDGTELSQQGVVVVTANYRLGPLGWLALPSLSQESENKASGNYGLLDDIASLKWVQTNIAAFGGDPGNVTVCGQSAGSCSVMLLMASPLNKGLFQRAIMESSSSYPTPSLADAEKAGEDFAAKLGVSGAPDVLKAMRAKSADEIVAAAGQPEGFPHASTQGFTSGPIIDGWFLQDKTLTIFQKGKQQNIPLIIGANSGDTQGILDGIDPVASAMIKIQPKVYVYEFTRVPPGWSKAGIPAIHVLELKYLFGDINNIDKFGTFAQITVEAQVDPVVDGKVSKEMMALWTRFAVTGDPNMEGMISWPTYDHASGQYLDIGEPLQVKSGFSKIKTTPFTK